MASFASRVLPYIVPAADQLYSQGEELEVPEQQQSDRREVYLPQQSRTTKLGSGRQERPGPINFGTTPPRPVTLECLTHTP